MPAPALPPKQGTVDWVKWLINGGPPNNKFSRITRQTNAFSASTLSYSIEKQVNVKAGIKETIPEASTYHMFKGSAVHLYIQSFLDETFTKEHEIIYRIPYDWKNLGFRDIVLTGHPDGFSAIEKVLIELKTSFTDRANAEIYEYYKRQSSFYHLVLQKQIGINLTTKVIKIWDNGVERGVSEWIGTPQEVDFYSKQMIDRAYEAAKKLDEMLGQRVMMPKAMEVGQKA